MVNNLQQALSEQKRATWLNSLINNPVTDFGVGMYSEPDPKQSEAFNLGSGFTGAQMTSNIPGPYDDMVATAMKGSAKIPMMAGFLLDRGLPALLSGKQRQMAEEMMQKLPKNPFFSHILDVTPEINRGDIASGSDKSFLLGDLISGTPLQKFFPESNELPIRFKPTSSGGNYSPDLNRIEIGSKGSNEDIQTRLMHELEHYWRKLTEQHPIGGSVAKLENKMSYLIDHLDDYMSRPGRPRQKEILTYLSNMLDNIKSGANTQTARDFYINSAMVMPHMFNKGELAADLIGNRFGSYPIINSMKMDKNNMAQLVKEKILSKLLIMPEINDVEKGLGLSRIIGKLGEVR